MHTDKQQATLVAVEGIDGSGKGTQTELLKERLQKDGLSVARMQFPRYSDTTFGQAIGDFLNGRFGSLEQVHPQLAAVLYAGDRFESRELLLSHMQECDIVILDRYTGSNLAHQGAKVSDTDRSDLVAWIDRVEHEIFGLPRPHLNVLIDISSQWSRELVGRKGERDYTNETADIQEADQDYLEGVRSVYRTLAAERTDWQVVCSLDENEELRSVESINDEILDLIRTVHGSPGASGHVPRSPF